MIKVGDIYKRFVNFLENGDFLLSIILVSVAHYTFVLRAYDWFPVAAFLGFSVDLANYRAIKLYLKDRGWALMLVTSVVSLAFHIAFYSLGHAGLWSILLGSSVPVAIFCMAYIAKVERLDSKVAKSVASVPTAKNGTPLAQDSTPSLPRGTYNEFVGAQMARNGNGPMSAGEVVAQFNVPKRTAYNWLAKYEVEHEADKN